MSFVNLDVTALGNSPSSQVAANQQSEMAVRRMASEFEALLLRQLTSNVNSNADDEDGESLFGNGGGLGLSRQLFSEQMADTMAKNGGVGLADLIVKQVMDNRAGKTKASANTAERAVDAARSIREKPAAKPENSAAMSGSQEVAPAITHRNRARVNPVSSELVNSNDIVIISRASDVNETTNKKFIAAPIARPDASDAPSEVSANDSTVSPLANSSANPNSTQRFLTENDVTSLVRPRRVSPLADVEETPSTLNVEDSPSVSDVEENASASTQPFVPVSGPSRRHISRPVNRSAVSSSNRVSSSFARVVNAPSARVEKETRMTNAEPVSLKMYVSGPIRSRFGPRIDPINGRLRYHTGIDIAAPAGTPIGAAAAGKVVFAGRNGGYGNMVIIEHADGTLTRYGHAEKLLVKEGDVVDSGQAIALVGSTGHSTGPHLHFEVKKNGQFVNPLTVLPKDFTLARR